MPKSAKLSIVTCTYNGERTIEEFLNGIFSQDYPLDEIELILMDGGSNDKTLDIIQEYKKKYPKIIRLVHNLKRYGDGRGMGVDNASRMAIGELLLFLDQDNILVQKDWLKNMIKILEGNKSVSAVQSRMLVPDDGTLIDKYLCAVGIEDPFIASYSLNAQINFHPGKFEYNYEDKYYLYEINKDRFFYAGSNGFLIRRKDFFDANGWVNDIDNFYRMAIKGYKVEVPKDVRLHHKTSTNLKHFLGKRRLYAEHYILKNYENRDFYWFNLEKNTYAQNLRFVGTILSNLAFLPGLLQGISMALKEEKAFWLIHPIMLFLMAINYAYSYFYTSFLKKEETAKI